MNDRKEFEYSLKFSLEWEGGFVDHPNDPGGKTNKGITQKTFDSWKAGQKQPTDSVINITDEEVYQIYYEKYWKPLPDIDNLDPPLQLALLDTAINFGVTGAIEFLQEALDVTVDGKFGQQTFDALLGSNDYELALRIASGRKDYRYLRVKRSPSQEVFLEGWLNRDEALISKIISLKQVKTLELMVVQNTTFKRSTHQSSELPDHEKLGIKKDTKFKLLHFADADKNHIVINLKQGIGDQNYNTWYVFKDHIELYGTEPDNNPKDYEVEKKRVGVILPGNKKVLLDDPILPDGSFTWADATKNGERIPESEYVVERIMAIAEALEWVRLKLDNRMLHVTSWYRPPAINAAVGGASQSRHIEGDAVDFYVDDLTPAQIYQKLDIWWADRGGLAPHHRFYFVHIDRRGYKARWTYGY